jgi:hypothetical protein
LAFALNIGLISELLIDGGGIVAAAAAFSAILAIKRGHLAVAIAFLAVAALAREAMLVVAIGSAFWLWRDGRSRAALASIAIPLAVVGGWWIYAKERLEALTSVSEVQEIGAPFIGLVSAIDSWRTSPLDLAAGAAVIVVLTLFARRAVGSKEVLLGWAFIGFVPIAILFTEQVWRSYFDITRAVAPIITAFLLLAFAYRGSERAHYGNSAGGAVEAP